MWSSLYILTLVGSVLKKSFLVVAVIEASSNLGHIAQLNGSTYTVCQFYEFLTNLRAIRGAEPPDRPNGANAECCPDISDGHRCSNAGDADVDFLIAIGKTAFHDLVEFKAQVRFGGSW